MLKSVTITNHLGKSLKVTLSEAEPSHGLLIKSITGIGPADATVNMSDYATNDGSEFNSARLDKRSIQITFMLVATDDCTVEQARHNTYAYFQPKKQVRLLFETDERSLYCYGRVEHNSPDIFQKQELATIDILCPDPYFYKITDEGQEDDVVEMSIISPAFSSEYLNPDNDSDETLKTFSTETDTQNLETGKYISEGVVQNVFLNTGDVDTSFDCIIRFNGGIEGNIIIANEKQEQIKIKSPVVEELIGTIIAPGDELHLSTNPKRRYLTLVKNGEEINVLNALDFDTLTWFSIPPGDSIINYYIDAGNDNTEASFSFKTLYLGV